MPDYFPNASNFSIGSSSNLSTVHGNQHNNYQIGTKSRRKQFSIENEEEEQRLAEYRNVRLGDIASIKHLGNSISYSYERLNETSWVRSECERSFFAAEVMSKSGKVSSTVVSYHGPEKEEAWKKDFHQFSGALNTTNVRIWGFNRSETPLLLLHNDLVPLAHFLDSVGGLGQLYLEILRRQLGCYDRELWLDSSRGVLCCGPEGPYCRIPYDIPPDLPVVLSDGKLLQEDTLVQYLATLKRSRDLDREVVWGLSYFSYTSAEPSDMRVDRPTVISSLTNTTIAVVDAGMSSIGARGSSCLGEREELSNGLTRFKLKHHRRHLELDWVWDWDWGWDWGWVEAWIAQSPMVFHAHGISMEANLSKYDLILPYSYNGTLSRSRTKRRRRQECDPIYLFACPSRASTFWSFAEDGHLPIPDDLCKHLGLPVKFSLKCIQRHFSTQTYKAMRDYQILRGFDPTTADFARHCGFDDLDFYPVQSSLPVATISRQFEDLDDSDFVVIEHESTDDRYCDESIPLLFGEVPPESTEMPEPAPEPAPSSTTFWLRLALPFL
ncbi:hypothetical protein V5O48_012893 [Marasmius crinis-equi]|uniref:Uncharacterized protein n=1 Tax=Marasmius crinis-equi TaxID=585013 RepID=A0ABR3F1L6_9AGAR